MTQGFFRRTRTGLGPGINMTWLVFSGLWLVNGIGSFFSSLVTGHWTLVTAAKRLVLVFRLVKKVQMQGARIVVRV